PRLAGFAAQRLRDPQRARGPARAAVLRRALGWRAPPRMDGSVGSTPAAQAVSLRDLFRQGGAARSALPGGARKGQPAQAGGAQAAIWLLGSLLSDCNRGNAVHFSVCRTILSGAARLEDHQRTVAGTDRPGAGQRQS